MNKRTTLTSRFELFSEPPVLAAISGLLLTFSFPGFWFGFLAWIALVPFFAALSKVNSRWDAVRLGALTGLFFFATSLHWLTHVAFIGWLFVAFVETFFFILFTAAVYEGRKLPAILRILWAGLAWTAFELCRSEAHAFGFGWNLLGYSQAGYPWVRSFASIIGVYGVSFLMVIVSAAVFEWQKQRKNYFLLIILSVFLLFAANDIYNAGRKAEPPKGQLKISVIQGNIPQELKWEPEVRGKIIDIYSKLTELAQLDGADLILWPEAAFPGYFNHDAEADKIHELVRKGGIPVIVGSPHLEDADNAYNSAYLLGPTGEIKDRYDKQKLVPFGEYVPLKLIFGWLERYAYSLGVSNFIAGKDPKVFDLLNHDFSFSVLICFEDIFPNIARRFVERGADFLAVITNDAWFGKTAAAHQHLQASVFRAVENGVPMVRAANTGVSAFLDREGNVLERVRDEKGNDIFITGRKTFALPINPRVTFYQKGGWLFVYAASILFLAGLPFVYLFSGRKKS